MTNFPNETSLPIERPAMGATVFSHPDDVRDDPQLSRSEKRELLASWASDANAVPHLPALRQLPNGSIVKLDDILAALKALDEQGDRTLGRSPLWQKSIKHQRRVSPRRWFQYGRRPDDDDDPPPCPALAAVRPRSGGGAAYAVPEPAAA
jgi:hypothetical protein